MLKNRLAPALTLALATLWMPSAQAATVSVTCTGGDDTALIQSALDSLSSGDTLVFYSSSFGMSTNTCNISNGLLLGSSSSPGALTNITIDGNGITLQATDDMTTIDSSGTEHTNWTASATRAHMLTLAGIDGLEVRDLTLDGNRANRWACRGITSSSIYGNSGNLALIAVTDALIEDVSSFEAFSDSVYIDGHESAPSERVEISRLNAEGAWRNNVTISDCTDCTIVNSSLVDGLQSIDIEPYATTYSSGLTLTRTASNIVIRENALTDPTGRCMSISQVDDTYVNNITFEKNWVVGCKQDTSYETIGRIFKVTNTYGVRIAGNYFDDINASSKDNGGSSLIRFQGSWNVEFEENEFYDVTYDSDVELIYIWDDSGDPSLPLYGAQSTVHVRNNRFYGIPYLSDPTMWCWVGSTSLFKGDVEANTYGNLIPDAVGSMFVASGCTL